MFGKAPIADLLGEGLKVTSRSSWLPALWSPPCIPVANICPLGTRFMSHADSKATGTEAQILKVSAFHIRPFLSWPSFTSHSFLKGLAMCSLWKAVPQIALKAPLLDVWLDNSLRESPTSVSSGLSGASVSPEKSPPNCPSEGRQSPGTGALTLCTENLTYFPFSLLRLLGPPPMAAPLIFLKEGRKRLLPASEVIPSSSNRLSGYSFLSSFPSRGGAPNPWGLWGFCSLNRAALGFSHQPLASCFLRFAQTIITHLPALLLPHTRCFLSLISWTPAGLCLFRWPLIAFWVDLRRKRSIISGVTPLSLTRSPIRGPSSVWMWLNFTILTRNVMYYYHTHSWMRKKKITEEFWNLLIF